FYGRPSRKLAVVGVTGTEGKSSTAAFIWQLLRLAGRKAGFISTVQYSEGGDAVDNPVHQTTPEAPVVQARLSGMVRAGCAFAVVEASSHGLSPRTNRLGDVLFDGAVMMNVAREHLEFHGTWEQYRDDKANLFRGLSAGGHIKQIDGRDARIPSFGLVNLDDPSWAYFAAAAGGAGITGFSCGTPGAEESPGAPGADFLGPGRYVAENIRAGEGGIDFRVRGPESFSVEAPLPGAFNAWNVLAAVLAVSRLTGIPPAVVADKAPLLTPVRGRMTKIDCGQDFEVYVDYAHTPSSFNAVFPALRARVRGRIIAVFGSGGERDTAKRPEQGRVAARFCDTVILADEDPRGEDPVALLSAIEAGCCAGGKIPGKDVFIIPDRAAAIRRAFALASPGDMVLLLGKSHENSIIYRDYVMPWDEIAEAKKALQEIL
ncbi:MAG: UDP-N-acetylmuramyl-tripeptide synthetase, partial [Spirochaetaceae bacterium]|nr:UDP-N-acetylmuramyl-tripeptide synthetase [Spirochaetaceae bacterium]